MKILYITDNKGHQGNSVIVVEMTVLVLALLLNYYYHSDDSMTIVLADVLTIVSSSLDRTF